MDACECERLCAVQRKDQLCIEEKEHPHVTLFKYYVKIYLFWEEGQRERET